MGYTTRLNERGAIATRYTSHQGIDHDALDAFGYDWERVGRPDIPPVYPAKIYLPRTTDDIVAAVREAKQLGQTLTVRSRGHSSNRLVLTPGPLLSTSLLNRILAVDERQMTATVQAGVMSADVDDLLDARGYGLPVIGDHNDITVGGFASVGGIGPASFRHGLFIDNVVGLEYVTFDGEVVSCSRSLNPDHFFRVLCGTGRFGIIATITCRIIRIEKRRTVLRNHRRVFTRVESFVEASAPIVASPDGLAMLRAAWNDAGTVRIGHVSCYRDTRQSGWKSLRARTGYGFYHRVGRRAGLLSPRRETIARALGTVGVLLPPRYGTIKDVEFFSDRMLSSTAGERSRWFILLVPSQSYRALFRAVYELGLEFRARYGCFHAVCMYVKALRSAYLSPDPNQYYCEMILFTTMTARALQEPELDDLVSRLDDLCLAHGALRYMHSRTVADPERRDRLDPNIVFARRAAAAS
ncbi:MAG TPA: FAD-binding oxidoreductase [Vicinamibacterales bacterium]|nr:FAD-binding oxidoreductase [Vicinamibacterales bacterium]